MKTKLLLLSLVIYSTSTYAQDSAKIFFNTGVGVVKVNPSLHHVLKPAVAFNSGIEFINKKNWLLQGTFDFNTLKYDQHIKDDGSDLLFRNTSSSLLMAGINGGKNFRLSSTWFTTGYVGGGFLSIGEPRVMIENNTVTQEIKRKSSVFGRGGIRIGKRTKVSLLQTVYLDASWWGTNLKVQGNDFTGFAFYLGTRMAVGK